MVPVSFVQNLFIFFPLDSSILDLELPQKTASHKFVVLSNLIPFGTNSSLLLFFSNATPPKIIIWHVGQSQLFRGTSPSAPGAAGGADRSSNCATFLPFGWWELGGQESTSCYHYHRGREVLACVFSRLVSALRPSFPHRSIFSLPLFSPLVPQHLVSQANTPDGVMILSLLQVIGGHAPWLPRTLCAGSCLTPSYITVSQFLSRDRQIFDRSQGKLTA